VAGYSKINYDFNDLPKWITNLRDELDLSGVGVSFVRLPLGKGYTFLHKHKEQEEVYIVLDGKGVIYLDGNLSNISKGDIIRVDPKVERALTASNKCELVCLIVGALPAKGYPKNIKYRSLIDDGIPNWEKLPPWYEDNKKVIEINKKIQKERGEGL